MTIALLVGNGVNRLNNSEASWEHVLKVLSAGNTTANELEFIKHKPFALLYEEILLATVEAGSRLDEMPVKRKIAELVDSLKGNDFHRRIMASGTRHVLTTNYDYNLEKATLQRFPRSNLQPETKYSVFRRRAVAEQFVWHLHGESKTPSTITLGFDQYSGYLQKLRGHATAERSGEKGSPFKRGWLDFDERDDCMYSWLDVLLRDDVHIIGLGFDFTEIDLWWALTYKARLAARGWSVGKTYYHDWHESHLDGTGLAKRSLLAALGAEVRSRVCEDGYEPLYDNFLAKEFGV